jgi:hypothetical protein
MNSKGYILSPYDQGTGYLCVDLYTNKTRKKCLINRLVARAFIGISNGNEVDHVDGNKCNNDFSNLRYVTSKQNQQHTKEMGLFSIGDNHWTHRHPEKVKKGVRAWLVQKGENHHMHKLTENDVILIRSLNYIGYQRWCLGLMFGICTQMIDNIVTGKNWRHI